MAIGWRLARTAAFGKLAVEAEGLQVAERRRRPSGCRLKGTAFATTLSTTARPPLNFSHQSPEADALTDFVLSAPRRGIEADLRPHETWLAPLAETPDAILGVIDGGFQTKHAIAEERTVERPVAGIS